MKSLGYSEKEKRIIIELNKTGQLNLIKESFEELRKRVLIGIGDPIDFESSVEILLKQVDEQDLISSQVKRIYRNKIADLFSRNKKYQLDKKTTSEFNKLNKLKNELDDLENILPEYNKKSIIKHRSKIKKLVRLYKRTTTRFDDQTELEQIFDIITKSIIFELTPGYHVGYEMIQSVEEITAYYLQIIDDIFFDKSMENQLAMMIDRFYDDIAMLVTTDQLHSASKL